MPTLSAVAAEISSIAADAIVVGIYSTSDGPALTPGALLVNDAMGGRLDAALESLRISGADGEIAKLSTLDTLANIKIVAVVGLGSQPDQPATDSIRRAAGVASRALMGCDLVASTLGYTTDVDHDSSALQAAGEGALLGCYEFTGYKKPLPDKKNPPSQILLLATSPSESRTIEAIRRAEAIANAVNMTRDLINTPPNDLPPAKLAEFAESTGTARGIQVEILDETQLATDGYGGILGVGGGSTRPPRLVRMRYLGNPVNERPTVALVGKGITFDSGGISIKPAAQMDEMKYDMSGAAAVIATMALIADLRLPLNVTATIPIAENLPSGSAYRPGDVLKMYGGKTVEVLNTDAEGRLILSDAIVRACEDQPTYLMETSTLTGAARVSLGVRTAGVMGSTGFRDRVVAVSNDTGEAMWAMPLPPELRKKLDSSVADLVNTPHERFGSMLVAGHFLSEFVAENVEWVHIDIAGPAYNSGEAWGHTPKGATGCPVRTLFATLENIAENG